MHLFTTRLVGSLALGLFLSSDGIAQYSLSTLATFNDSNGRSPDAALYLDAEGNLFGTTSYGGTGQWGTVFEIPSGTGKLNTLASFDDTNQSLPNSGFMVDASVDLVGTTEYGGTYNSGTIYEVSASTHTVSTLVTFNGGLNGANPLGPLIADSKGNLYGTTRTGAVNGFGTVFEILASNHSIISLATFNLTNGANPYGGLVADAAGNMYGTTYNGSGNFGTVFEITAQTHQLSTLVGFSGPNGMHPTAGLTVDANGNLFGVTSAGGVNNDGTVFEISANTHTFSTVINFNGANGSTPWGGLTTDASGNLYGTTFNGGSGGNGTVFKIDAVSRSLTTLTSFDGTNGSGPSAPLFEDASGSFYGTTYLGGASNDGTVFRLSPVPEPSTIALSCFAIASAIVALCSKVRGRPTMLSRPRRTVAMLLVVVIGTVHSSDAIAQDKDATRVTEERPEDNQTRSEPNRLASVKNLKNIMLAMHGYAEQHEFVFPPAFTARDGKPLLSWRVIILPYLGDDGAAGAAVYKEFHLDEPWDSEHNKTLIAKMPAIYRSPKSKLNDGRTRYLTPRGDSTAFPGTTGASLLKITDGHSNTISAVEVDDEHAVPWTKPEDWRIEPDRPKNGLAGQYNGGFLAAFCDGHAGRISLSIEDAMLTNLLTIAGGEHPSLNPKP